MSSPSPSRAHCRSGSPKKEKMFIEEQKELFIKNSNYNDNKIKAGKVANVRYWSRTLVVDVVLYCYLAAILKTT